MRGEKKKKMQENLRIQVKLVKALYGDIFSYKDIADLLQININSFYNWLNGAYNLSREKEKLLQLWLNDVLV